MIAFDLVGEPTVGLNERSHWAVRYRRGKILQDIVFGLAWNAGYRKTMGKFNRVRVKIVGWRGDKDNAIGGCKPIVDALWHNYFIASDNKRDCKITYALIPGRTKFVRIEMEAV